jgi:tetratricopeptide (TPR) repeat protein
MAEEKINEQRVKEYYNKGLFAFEKKNYDYAIELFLQVLSLKKDFADARHYLRLAEQRKFQENPPGAFEAFWNKIKNLPAFISAIILDIKNDSAGAIDVYERILMSEPNNTYILTRLGQDLLKERDAASALRVFEQIKLIDEKNIVALKNLGQLYSQMENYQAARQSYEAILKIVPHDHEAEKGLKNLDALGAIKESFGQSE